MGPLLSSRKHVRYMRARFQRFVTDGGITSTHFYGNSPVVLTFRLFLEKSLCKRGRGEVPGISRFLEDDILLYFNKDNRRGNDRRVCLPWNRCPHDLLIRLYA